MKQPQTYTQVRFVEASFRCLGHSNLLWQDSEIDCVRVEDFPCLQENVAWALNLKRSCGQVATFSCFTVAAHSRFLDRGAYIFSL